MEEHRKAINFDLDTKALQKIFQSKNPFVYMEGYRKIGSFLKSRGFKHRQWSGYISEEPISNTELTGIVKQLNKSLPWLKSCVKRFDVTNIGATFDLLFLFDKQNVKAPVKEQDSKQADKPQKPQQQAVLSVKDIRRSAKMIAETERSAHRNERSRNKDNVL